MPRNYNNRRRTTVVDTANTQRIAELEAQLAQKDITIHILQQNVVEEKRARFSVSRSCMDALRKNENLIHALEQTNEELMNLRTINRNRASRPNEDKPHNGFYFDSKDTIANTLWNVKEDSKQANDCPCCLEKIKMEDHILTRCGHSYCDECFVKIINGKDECAVCRTKIGIQDI